MTPIGALRLLPAVLAVLVSAGSALAAPEFVLVGAIVNGTEVGGLSAQREGETWYLPLEELADLTGCGLERLDSRATLKTSLGEVTFEASELRLLDGVAHLSSDVAAERLAMSLTFDEAQYALRLEMPWSGPASAGAAALAEDVEPDVRAPRAGLSSLRVESRFSWDGGSLDGQAVTTLDGRLAGGRWRLRYRQGLDGSPGLEDYAWLATSGHHLFLAGRQRASLHSVLRSFEFTGLQHAWTNQPLELFQIAPDARELLPRRLQPVSTLRGPGPPGGFAELMIDGIRSQRVSIGFSGEYEFLDVPISPRRLNDIEVRVFERRSPEVPVAIHDHSTRGHEFLLPRGARVLSSGLGFEGNLLDDLLGNGEGGPDGVGAYVQARFGLTANWTLETAAQHDGGDGAVMAGFVGRLPGDILASAAIGLDAGGPAHELSLDQEWSRWRWVARSRSQPPSADEKEGSGTSDHQIELGWRRSARLDLALIARDRTSEGGHWSFLLPSVSWRPRDDLGLRARPDSEGSMQLDVEYRPKPWSRLAVSMGERLFIDSTFDLGAHYQLSARTEHGGGQSARQAAGVRWSSGGRRQLQLGAEFEMAAGGAGYRLDGKAKLAAGLLGTWVVEDGAGGSGDGGPRLEVGLSLDLAVAGGKLVPASASRSHGERGGVAGRIVAAGGVASGVLEGLTITVDGNGRASTEAGGRFSLSNLTPGLHAIALDTADLPIELVPVKRVVLAEIAAGAVTRVDFEVKAEYGIAGRVTDADDRRLVSVPLELIDAAGVRVAAAETDRFGLYRMDGLAPGRYTLAVQAGDPRAQGAPQATVALTDDFLFGQDLVLPARPRVEGAPLVQLTALSEL